MQKILDVQCMCTKKERGIAMSVTYKDIEDVCKQLFVQNPKEITTRRVREKLGHGSLSTISKHLKTWRELSLSVQDNVHHLSVHSVQPAHSLQYSTTKKHPVRTVSTKTSKVSEKIDSLQKSFERFEAKIDSGMYHEIRHEPLEEAKPTSDSALENSSIEQNKGESRNFPVFQGFSEISEKLSLLQERFEGFENKIESEASPKVTPEFLKEMEESLLQKLNTLQKNLESNVEQEVSQIHLVPTPSQDSENPSTTQSQVTLPSQLPTAKCSSSIRWEKLFSLLSHPEPVLLGVFALILSSYLVHQNFSFFRTIESSDEAAIINAIISEIVLILSAASLAFTSKKMHRALLGVFLFGTIAGLGIFFHKSLSENSVSKSAQVEMLIQEKELASKTVGLHFASIESLPQDYISKRQNLEHKIEQERAKISELNSRIENSKTSAISSQTSKVTYAFWLRLAAMLLNAYLIHCLFSRLKRSWI